MSGKCVVCPGSRSAARGANPEAGEIQAVVLPENTVSDDGVLTVVLEQMEPKMVNFAAEGAYDKRKVYNCLNTHLPAVNILISPHKHARIGKPGHTQAERPKPDANLRSIRKHGRKAWQKDSG